MEIAWATLVLSDCAVGLPGLAGGMIKAHDLLFLKQFEKPLQLVQILKLIIIGKYHSFLMVQWVKDLALSLLWLGFDTSCDRGSISVPGIFTWCECTSPPPKKGKKKIIKNRKSMFQGEVSS